ncbi:hypothetical protein [Mycoplasmoides genitalium]|uniref:Uncharacterized protein n=1 Tax=Mycoplasmoides genitalium M6320 TaxID=662945 RepID=A0ABC7ZKA7_MYCGT|nr:hypothetical protein [Mycoplasmoides genitalium]AFQ03200.1 hypothetical protein CM9_02140 [Mycoplasmoides genitalium M2321]AFQ03684.1 hypothetical protein CM3_02260 [Mycoplasmoides genitalium M6282]AFQ04191.1 hypothetical protein CM1_02175 [Mycoplasmoides genitalium M6320]AFQ04694.1 hypothetical protein CM5_02120 [Mycoplasmoides genitalium M2288]
MKIKKCYIIAVISAFIGFLFYFLSSLIGITDVNNAKTVATVFFVLATLIVVNAIVFWILYLFKKKNVVK